MRNLQFAETGEDSAGRVLHDGGQPWRVRRQPGVGTCTPEVDHRKGLLHLLAPETDRDPLEGSGRRLVTRGASCSPSTVTSAGASWPGPTRRAVVRSPARSPPRR